LLLGHSRNLGKAEIRKGRAKEWGEEMPSLKIEVIGNICCLIEEQQLLLQIGKA
jgi:hypothetical protein